jgi:hypothetical protein
LLERGEGPGRVADQALQLLSDQVGRQASLLACSDVFRVVGLLFLLALPLVLLTGGRAKSAAGGGVNLGCRLRPRGRAHNESAGAP